MEKVFAFDVGTASLGIAVRKDFDMIRYESLLLPQEAGGMDELREARRQYRTRLAHAAREAYWKRICEEAGIEVLHSRIHGDASLHIPSSPGDPRLEREFAAPGDETIYTSCLLRIKLLQGAKLEGWQVFKAVRSALQRRGFDRNVPWKNRAASKTNADDDSKTAKNAMEYEKMLLEIVNQQREYLYPCYFDAFQMGLWNPRNNQILLRPSKISNRARGYTPPRELVIAELSALLQNAAKLFPKLVGKIDEVLWGPGKEQYASFFAEKRNALHLKEGSAGDWESLLGQKIPRFDNRQPGKCALIPRFHVCQASDTAIIESTFLLKVKNLRVLSPEGKEVFFSPETIRVILDTARIKARAKREELRLAQADKEAIQAAVASAYKIAKTDLKKTLRSMKYDILPGNEEVEAPKISGRARLSRPAAKIMRDLILSGESPRAFYQKLLQCPPKDIPGATLSDDLQFLLMMPDSWEGIHIPDMAGKKIQESAQSPDDLVRQLIAEQRSPIVRLRLEIFDRELKRLLDDPAIGKPDRIVMEFVRGDFLGEEKKRKLEAEIKRRHKENLEIRTTATEQGYSSGTDLLKLKLLKEQAYVCPYTGDVLSCFALEDLEVDHIVPRHGGKNGSDGFTNKVVTSRTTNQLKGARTPYEFLHGSGKWTAYCNRVMAMKVSKRKQRLLLSPDAEKLDQKYSDLCSTAWIARVFRDIAAVRCCWPEGAIGSERHIVVINGAITAALRRRYRIDSLLAPECKSADEIEKKNRDDKRHHALDAMVLTFTTFWMRNPALRDKLALPDKIDRYYFQKYIDEVNPRNIIFPRAGLEKTIYGKREIDGQSKMTKREDIVSFGIDNKGKFVEKSVLSNFRDVCDEKLRSYLQTSFANAKIDSTEKWMFWCQNLKSPDTGMPIKKVRIVKGGIEEYKNLSKDGDVFGGQYRKGDQHKGYFVYLDTKNKPRVAPVYAHASVSLEREKLCKLGFTVVDFFQSGCSVEIKVHAISGKNHVSPGVYMLTSIWTQGTIALFKNGEKYLVSLSSISDIASNLKRC